MNIKIYALPNCPMCKMLHSRLEQKKIEHEYIVNEIKIIELGQMTGISSAPIVEVDGQYFNLQLASKVIGL